MNNRIRLIDESILTEDMLDIRIHLGQATKVLSKLSSGGDRTDYVQSLNKLDMIIDILDCLYQKNTSSARSKIRFLNTKYKIDEIKDKIKEYEDKLDKKETEKED